MVLLVAMLIGIAAGVGGGILKRRNLDYFMFNILAGVVGAILGLAVYVLALQGDSDALITFGGILSTLLGAVLIELLFLFVLSLPKKKKESIE